MSLTSAAHAHPFVVVWSVLMALTAAFVVTSPTRRARWLDGRLVAVGALGAMALLGVAPPPGGPVPGLPHTLDLDVGHLLWPWRWTEQDPRMGVIVLMVIAGAAISRRPRWTAGAFLLPVVLEAVQYALPGLARVGSVADIVHAWVGLAVGLGAGLVLGLVTQGRTALAAPGLLRPVTAVGTAVGLAIPLITWTAGVEPAVAARDRAASVAAQAEFTATPSRPIPGTGTPYADMATRAVQDLVAMVHLGDGAPGLPAAGPDGPWAYFWPRDGSFVAVALARSGQPRAALSLLSRMNDLHLDPMYGFDARYLLSGERVTLDPRRAQGDGCGWTLWAIHEVTSESEGDLPVPATVDALRDRCTDQLLRATGGGTRLPPPSADYWEHTTFEQLLGVSAPIAAGLRAAAADYQRLGRSARAATVEHAAATLRSRIGAAFGPGFQRVGDRGGLDASSAMLLPPFDPDPLPGAVDAWRGYQAGAPRPGGGLAPGVAWKQDGVSWTPEVALVALTAAESGDDATARRWLDWLAAHRTETGSLPEKVDADGHPAGPAPLAWTSALVLLTLDALAQG